jgi:hypothetical protein
LGSELGNDALNDLETKQSIVASLKRFADNPSWLTPYFSCVLVGVGLVVQFIQHLLGFAKKRGTQP